MFARKFRYVSLVAKRAHNIGVLWHLLARCIDDLVPVHGPDYTATIPQPTAYEFSKHIGDLCVIRGTGIYKLGPKLGIEPMELLRIINGNVVLNKAVLVGLAKESGRDLSYLKRLAAEIKP